MKIVIAGAGEVGTHLAKLLGQENHDITLMDENKEKMIVIRDNVELLTYVGNCMSPKDLTAAGAAGADLFIAVTPLEANNMTAAMLASNLGAKKTLARIDNYEYLLPKNLEFFQKNGSQLHDLSRNDGSARSGFGVENTLVENLVGALQRFGNSVGSKNQEQCRNCKQISLRITKRGQKISHRSHQTKRTHFYPERKRPNSSK